MNTYFSQVKFSVDSGLFGSFGSSPVPSPSPCEVGNIKSKIDLCSGWQSLIKVEFSGLLGSRPVPSPSPA